SRGQIGHCRERARHDGIGGNLKRADCHVRVSSSMETITLSRKELHRPGLLKAACDGRITNRQLAGALGITIPEAARGALIQIDGSPFAWLEDRGPAQMLL